MTDEPAQTATPPAPLWRRLLPLALLLVALAVFLALGGGRYLSWEAVSARYGDLTAFVAAHKVQAALIFVLVYIAVVAMVFVPVASVLTISSGLLFGTLLGGALTVVGATVGATIVFLSSRSAFGNLLTKRAGGALASLRDGFERDAFSYLLALRLTPVVPFWVINLAAGLFGVRLSHFFTATALGIMPATFIFASIGAGAGVALAAGRSVAFSELVQQPQIFLPLVGLGLLSLIPVIVKKVRGK
jgi:uncharacterized membrane protein YdjX (TVP38/TMEM64 family)